MQLYSHTANGTLYQGDCLDVLKFVPPDSIDTIITDPPYGLSFMGKKWDYDVPSVEIWKECLRVLKPGATALIFAGSRTQHRMAVNVEGSGFVLKDTIMWIYGSGFPKSTDISKQLDKTNGRNLELFKEIGRYIKIQREKTGISLKDLNKRFGYVVGCNWWESQNDNNVRLPNLKDWLRLKEILDLDNRFDTTVQRIEAEREVIGKNLQGVGSDSGSGCYNLNNGESDMKKEFDITAPATNEAKTWNGWGTALKPAYEPILVAMKPNDGTYAQNALRHGVAGLHIDGGRIGSETRTYDLKGGENLNKLSRPMGNDTEEAKGCGAYGIGAKQTTIGQSTVKGRFPANVIFDSEAARLLDEQSGILKSGARNGLRASRVSFGENGAFKEKARDTGKNTEASQGGASRFFYCAKASKSERNAGCEGLEAVVTDDGREVAADNAYQRGKNLRTNSHPTVKPLALMEYLCNLTKTPSGGTVLDPFAGSGTTGIACVNTSRLYTLIERNEDYCRIIAARLGQAWFNKLCSEKNVRSNP